MALRAIAKIVAIILRAAAERANASGASHRAPCALARAPTVVTIS
jgi:hypothetical protein